MSGASNLHAHLTPLPIEVTAAGHSYTIPAMDAVAWVALLGDPDMPLHEIFPNLAGQQPAEFIEDLIWEGGITSKEVDQIAYDIITAAGDRPWWITIRVIHAARGAWDRVYVNDAAGKSLAGWLDEVWWRIISQIDPKKLASFTNEIETPPKGFETEVDFDAEERAFLAAMKAVAT